MGTGPENASEPETRTASAASVAPAEPAAQAAFGTPTAVFVVVASMIGTGVLTTSGYTMYLVGSNQVMMALWLVGALVAVCGALSLAELSAAMPRSGGDYVFLYEGYGPLAGFLSGWVSFLIGFGGPIAASAFAAAKYLLAPWELSGPRAELAQLTLATVAILVLGLVHASSRSQGARVQGTVTTLKLGFLCVLAAAGLAAAWGRWEHLADWPPIDAKRAVTVVYSLVYISYAYTGWNAASYLAGEIQEPQRKLPRAILLGTTLVVGVYVALNLFYALALSAQDVRQVVEDPKNTQGLDAVAPIAQLAAARVFGARISSGLSMAIGVTLLASLSAYILTGPRVIHAMAQAGQFPAMAGRLSARSGAPVVATVMQVAWALLLLWTGSFEKILVYSSFGLGLLSMMTISTVYVLRWRRPELPRPFRAPGYPLTPGVYLLVTGCLSAAVVKERPQVAAYSLLSILAGVPFYYLGRFNKGSAVKGTSTSRDAEGLL